MPPLHRAIALEQVHQIAVQIAQELHFDVPGAADVFFQEDIAVAESGRRFALGGFQHRRKFVGRIDGAHAAAAAAVGRFQHDRIAKLLGRCFRFFQIADGFGGAAQNRHIRFAGDFACGRFVAELFQ